MGFGDGGARMASQAPVLEGFEAFVFAFLLHPDFVLGEEAPLEQSLKSCAVLAHRRIIMAGSGHLVGFGEALALVLAAVGPAAHDRLLGGPSSKDGLGVNGATRVVANVY